MTGPRGDATRVAFLVAGVQKGGTSALFEYLRDVPGLQLPAVKEAHHFDDETGVDWSAPDHSGYHRLFMDDGRPWGEATPIYLYWPESLARIRRYNPAMRIILIFRNPVERAWSHWKMEWARGKETMPFAWAIREGRARVASGDPAAPGHHRVFSYVERGFYGAQLARALDLFPSEQLLVLRSDELRRAPTAAIRTICRFLGVAAPGHVVPRSVRMAAEADYPSVLTDADRLYLESLYAADRARFDALLSASVLNPTD